MGRSTDRERWRGRCLAGKRAREILYKSGNHSRPRLPPPWGVPDLIPAREVVPKAETVNTVLTGNTRSGTADGSNEFYQDPKTSQRGSAPGTLSGKALANREEIPTRTCSLSSFFSLSNARASVGGQLQSRKRDEFRPVLAHKRAR
ncbi:hypothetical protein MRX96_013027 [Rhipicephalus microplus]